MFITGDVTKKAACVKLVADTVAEFGRLDILVNNAGTSIRKMPQDYTEEEWHEVLDTNLTSAFLCSQAAYRADEGGGRRQDDQHRLDDVAVRRALRDTVCVEQGRHRADDARDGDRVGKGQHPGECGAARLDRHRPDESRAREVPGLHQRVEDRTPAGRWGTPPDMSGIAAFLASPASDFVTGTAIPVDGGYSIGM